MKKLEAQHTKVCEELESAKQGHNEQEIRVVELTKDFERAEIEVQNVAEAVRKQDQVIAGHRTQIQDGWEKHSEVVGLITKTIEKKQSLDEAVESLSQELEDSRSGVESLQDEVVQLQVLLAAEKQKVQGLEHQAAMVDKSLEEVNQQLAEMSEESAKSTDSLSSYRVLIETSQLDLERWIRETEESAKVLSLNQDEYEQLACPDSRGRR